MEKLEKHWVKLTTLIENQENINDSRKKLPIPIILESI